jgi:hypothetical protein
MARPSKDSHIISRIDTIINSEITTKDLATFCNCSYPTIVNFIKSYPERFNKTGHGLYRILPFNSSLDLTATNAQLAEKYTEIIRTAALWATSSNQMSFDLDSPLEEQQHPTVKSIPEDQYTDPVVKFVTQQFDW